MVPALAGRWRSAPRVCFGVVLGDGSGEIQLVKWASSANHPFQSGKAGGSFNRLIAPSFHGQLFANTFNEEIVNLKELKILVSRRTCAAPAPAAGSRSAVAGRVPQVNGFANWHDFSF